MPSNSRLSILTVTALLSILSLVGCSQVKNPNHEENANSQGSNWISTIQGLAKAPSPVETHLLVDVSESSEGSGQLGLLTAAICDQVKTHIRTGDGLRITPFAAESDTTHAVTFNNRMELMGMCQDKNFANYITSAAIAADVASTAGTSLSNAVQKMKPEKTQTKKHEASTGKVNFLLVHADDSGLGAHQEVPLTEIVEQMESLLNEKNTVLVVFAMDGDLRRKLDKALQHPQAKVSPLSEQSIEESIQWAYEIARSLSVPATQTEKGAHQTTSSL